MGDKSVTFVLLILLCSICVNTLSIWTAKAQPSGLFKISGYILDSDEHGLADAMIIFSLPQIVPAVYSDSSGYYEISAPSGTYHLIVWPPFDSNYLSFDHPGFTVETSNISKNITLSSGYKLSGYLTDTSGVPIRGALASLDQFYCGWYSKNTGRYFVTAPAGTYTLTIQPKTGPTFPIYNENNFGLTNDTVKNFTLTITASLSPSPPDQSPVEPTLDPSPRPSTFYDNFDDDTLDNWTQNSGSWNFKNGEYCVSVGIVENGISILNGLNLKDCTIETKLRFTDDVGFRAGLVFRYMEKDTYYSLEVSNEYDVLCFVKYLPEYAGYGTQDHGFVGTAPTEVNFARGELMLGRKVIGSVPIATISKGVEYTLRVTTTGNTFFGELISDGFYQKIEWEDTDNPLEYGTVGLRARAAVVSFDYFKISNPILIPKPNLDISCHSSTSYSEFNVKIEGNLAFNGTAIPSAPIQLSYSVNGGKTFQDLTLVKTSFDGMYSATWNPSVTGIFLIRAVYEGDTNYLGTTTGVNFSVTQDAAKNVFSVNSNSTVSSLTFNSTSKTLSFIVTGDSGTKGYADVYVVKTLIQNAEGFEVLLDGNKLNHTVSSTRDCWQLRFVYSHSAHSISVNFGSSAQVAGDLLENFTFYGTIVTVIAILVVSVFILKKKKD